MMATTIAEPMETQEIPLSQLDIVGVLDPARSRESEYKLASRHAIVVTGMDWKMNVFVLHTWARRTDLNELLLQAEEACKLFPTMRCFGVESVAAQIVIHDVIAEWLRLNRISVPTVELKPDTRITKKWRIRMQIQRPATQGRLFIQAGQYDLDRELKGFPHSVTIDLVDALAYCISLHYPPEEYQDFIDYSPTVKSNLEKMFHDGKIPFVPKKPQQNQLPYSDLPELRPGLYPSLREIFPSRSEGRGE